MKIIKHVKNPVKAFKLLQQLCREKRKPVWQVLSNLFNNTSFYLQGRMDLEENSLWHCKEFNEQTGGFLTPGDKTKRSLLHLYRWDHTRRDMLILLMRTVCTRNVEGDFAEVGVYKGLSAKMIHHYAPEKKLHLFDTFGELDERDSEVEKKETGQDYNKDWFSDCSVESVSRYINAQNDNLVIHQGYFPESIPKAIYKSKFAFVHIDISLYKPTYAAIDFFYERLSPLGIIAIHDYNSNISVRKAIDAFIDKNPHVKLVPMPDKSGSAIIMK